MIPVLNLKNLHENIKRTKVTTIVAKTDGIKNVICNSTANILRLLVLNLYCSYSTNKYYFKRNTISRKKHRIVENLVLK